MTCVFAQLTNFCGSVVFSSPREAHFILKTVFLYAVLTVSIIFWVMEGCFSALLSF